MKMFAGVSERLAKNQDPMHRKKQWLKSFYLAGIMGGLGLLFLLTLGPDFTVFSVVLILAGLIAFLDGLAMKHRK